MSGFDPDDENGPAEPPMGWSGLAAAIALVAAAWGMVALIFGQVLP